MFSNHYVNTHKHCSVYTLFLTFCITLLSIVLATTQFEQ